MEGAARELRTEGSGLLVRNYRAALDGLGLLAAVRARVSPAAARLLTEPPPFMAWVPERWFFEVLLALEAQAGREGCRQLGLHGARLMTGGVMAPLVRTSAAVFGPTPSALLSRMGTLCLMIVRGVTFAFVQDGHRKGTLTLRYPAPVPSAFYAGYEGACLHVLELCRTTGEVATVRLAEEGRTGHIDVRW
ncbi:MAG: hypothetical protein L0Y66_01510 [Myxococcaceae bacterium]|nr:hypothetical protein [Myxococcaceae bacterium]MCI0672561.1 hypothetical protein [Myxococcaceae bacterium]